MGNPSFSSSLFRFLVFFLLTPLDVIGLFFGEEDAAKVRFRLLRVGSKRTRPPVAGRLLLPILLLLLLLLLILLLLVLFSLFVFGSGGGLPRALLFKPCSCGPNNGSDKAGFIIP